MNTLNLRQLRNFWILWITTIVLACFSNAVAQAGCQVSDLGTLPNNNLGCAVALNNQGWRLTMDGIADPGGNFKAELRFLYPIATASEPSNRIVSGDAGRPLYRAVR